VEISFQSLDDIRDVVRRAFLAGGLGLDDPGGIEPLTPERPNLETGAWNQVHDQLLSLESVDVRANTAKALTDLLGGPRPRAVLANLFEQVTRHLKPWSESNRPARQRDWADYLQWLSLAWDSIGIRTADEAHAWFRLYRGDDRYRFPYRPVMMPGVTRAPSHQRMRLLFRLPALGQFPSYPPIRTLGDQLLLACASRTCLRSLDTIDAFLPIAMSAIVLMGTANAHQLHGEAVDEELLLAPAMRWLTQMLPPKRNDQSVQERTLGSRLN
jgi:hypothetical protein